MEGAAETLGDEKMLLEFEKNMGLLSVEVTTNHVIQLFIPVSVLLILAAMTTAYSFSFFTNDYPTYSSLV